MQFAPFRASTYLLTASLVALASAFPNRAQAQDQYVTFAIATTFTTPFPNNLPPPVTVVPAVFCYYQHSSSTTTYNAITRQITYFSTATITAPFFVTETGLIGVNCSFRLEGFGQSLFINDFAYVPSSGQIVADLNANNTSNGVPFEIAYLLYVDDIAPGHYIYHFRANHALLALAQQSFGVDFTGVEFTFDVQEPSS